MLSPGLRVLQILQHKPHKLMCHLLINKFIYYLFNVVMSLCRPFVVKLIISLQFPSQIMRMHDYLMSGARDTTILLYRAYKLTSRMHRQHGYRYDITT